MPVVRVAHKGTGGANRQRAMTAQESERSKAPAPSSGGPRTSQYVGNSRFTVLEGNKYVTAGNFLDIEKQKLETVKQKIAQNESLVIQVLQNHDKNNDGLLQREELKAMMIEYVKEKRIRDESMIMKGVKSIKKVSDKATGSLGVGSVTGSLTGSISGGNGNTNGGAGGGNLNNSNGGTGGSGGLFDQDSPGDYPNVTDGKNDDGGSGSVQQKYTNQIAPDGLSSLNPRKEDVNGQNDDTNQENTNSNQNLNDNLTQILDETASESKIQKIGDRNMKSQVSFGITEQTEIDRINSINSTSDSNDINNDITASSSIGGVDGNPDVTEQELNFLMSTCDKDNNESLDFTEIVFAVSIWNAYLSQRETLDKLLVQYFPPKGEVPQSLFDNAIKIAQGGPIAVQGPLSRKVKLDVYGQPIINQLNLGALGTPGSVSTSLALPLSVQSSGRSPRDHHLMRSSSQTIAAAQIQFQQQEEAKLQILKEKKEQSERLKTGDAEFYEKAVNKAASQKKEREKNEVQAKIDAEERAKNAKSDGNLDIMIDVGRGVQVPISKTLTSAKTVSELLSSPGQGQDNGVPGQQSGHNRLSGQCSPDMDNCSQKSGGGIGPGGPNVGNGQLNVSRVNSVQSNAGPGIGNDNVNNQNQDQQYQSDPKNAQIQELMILLNNGDQITIEDVVKVNKKLAALHKSVKNNKKRLKSMSEEDRRSLEKMHVMAALSGWYCGVEKRQIAKKRKKMICLCCAGD